MKLRNSIPVLSKIWEEVKDDPRLPAYIEHLQNNPKIKDTNIAFIWGVWSSLPREKRDIVIAASIPESEWIGGYPDINDNAIETLLKRVIKFEPKATTQKETNE